MKKLWKITAVVLALILALMLLLPMFFKDELASAVKEELNKNMNATINFNDFSLSLFRSFPDFSFELDGFSVVGHDDFRNDTLAYVQALYLQIDLFDVFQGDAYSIKSVRIQNPEIKVLVLEDGRTNYDIVPEEDSGTEEEVADSSDSPFLLKLQKFTIQGLNLVYDDRESDMWADIHALSLTLKGDLTATTTDVALQSEIQSLSYKMDGLRYLHKAHLTMDALLGANFDDYSFRFKDNKLIINTLPLSFNGVVAMPGDDVDIDLSFSSEGARFKSILSLVPAIYLTDFEGLKASGTASVSGKVKGIYNEHSMPAFQMDVLVDQGQFHYPELPGSVKDVSMRMTLNSPDDDLDHMLLDVHKLHANMGGSIWDMSLSLKTPMSDPQFKMAMKGKLNLEKIKDYYPLEEGSELKGLFAVDLNMKARMSDIDKGRYGKVLAEGYMKLNDFAYRDKELLPEGVALQNIMLEFNPRFIQLASMEVEYQKQHLELNGRLSNYFDYLLADGVLKGSMVLKSDYLNINKLLSSDKAPQELDESQASAADEQAMEAFVVPENIDFTFETFIGRMKYDKLNMSALYGKATLAESRLSLDDLKMDALGGKMNVSGFYSSLIPDTPHVSLLYAFNDVRIKEAYKALNSLRTFAPIAQYISGTFSALMSYNSKLSKTMDPLLNTVNSEGILKTGTWSLSGAPVFQQLADRMKYDKLKHIEAKPVMLSYQIIDGNLEVKPFKIEAQGVTATCSGRTNLDQSIDYTMNMSVPRAKLGGAANAAITQLTAGAQAVGLQLDAGETINFDVLISGKAGRPKVKVVPAGSSKSATDAVKQQAEDELEKAKQQALEEADKLKKEAEETADSLKREAQKQAQKELDKAREELDKQKKELERKKKEEEEKARKKLEEEAKKKLKGFF